MWTSRRLPEGGSNLTRAGKTGGKKRNPGRGMVYACMDPEDSGQPNNAERLIVVQAENHRVDSRVDLRVESSMES